MDCQAMSRVGNGVGMTVPAAAGACSCSAASCGRQQGSDKAWQCRQLFLRIAHRREDLVPVNHLVRVFGRHKRVPCAAEFCALLQLQV
jgi:hypothetical protein